jgi:DNA mismatch repair protein MutS
MAGKSTFIRTAALLTLLAHTGSFVPADKAVVGLTDRIFTRIGADDALHAGQSTFMVEMTETARILNHASPRSLIILDEIGRGTSTLDGLSLAWAIAETLAGKTSPRTLFATHYHELTDLEELLPGRVINLHVSVREWGEEIVFLHRILPGRTDRSYGVHVAKLAGLPAATVARAKEILETLAVQHHGPSSPAPPGEVLRAKQATEGAQRAGGNGQLPLFTEYIPHPAVDHLREIKLDAITPMQAFDALRRLKSLTESPQDT